MTTDRTDTNNAFTLIELLVVIAIIGLLSSVVLASLSGARSSARYANVVQQMEAIADAAQLYEVQNGSWAPDVGSAEAPNFVPDQLNSWPEPPCGRYDYENWTDNSSSDPDIRVSLRGVTGGPYQYCVAHDQPNECPDGSVYNSEKSIKSINSISC